MANFYCDHGAYGLASNRLGLDVPTWGVPQEGDGTSKDAATASSVASVDLTSITSTAGTFTLFGSSAISVGASASGATLATQIAAAINASTVTTGNTSIFPGAPQLRNAFYAQATGATLEIMCRIGSALTNVLGLAWAGTWSAGPPSSLTFSGGSGGCWGWFINPAALGASSSIGVLTYGAFLYKPYAGTLPTPNDAIYVRTGGGASKTISYAPTSNTTLTPGAFDRNLIFDTDTKWTGDSTSGKMLLQLYTSTYQRTITLYLTAANYSSSLLAIAQGGFELEFWDTGGTAATMTVISVHSSGGNCVEYCRNVVFRDSTPAVVGNSAMSFAGSGLGSLLTRVWENCKYTRTYARSTIISQLFFVGTYGTTLDQRYIGCTFDFNISGVSDPGGLVSTGQLYETSLLLKDCNFIGFANGYTLISSLGSWPASALNMSVVIDNCTGLKMPVTYVGMPTITAHARQHIHQLVFSNSLAGDFPGFRTEDCRGVCEWVPNDPTPFPTATAIFPGNNAAWSQRIIWLLAVPLRKGRPYQSPIIRDFTQLAVGARTITLLAFLPASVTKDVRVAFGYTDSSGAAQSIISDDIQSDSTNWENAASYPGFSAKKFSVTTPVSVKANSEITAMIELTGPPPSGSDTSFYFNPELVVS